MKNYFIYIACLILIASSCTKKTLSTETPDGPPVVIPPVVTPPVVTPPVDNYANYDIYVTGYSVPLSKLWKNLKPVYEAHSTTSGLSGLTKNFCVSGTDIYQGAIRQYRNTGDSEGDMGGCILKNGAEIFSDAGIATSISGLSVINGDVYYLSSHYQNADLAVSRPKVWKNGVFQYNLPTIYGGGTQQAFDLYVVGSDVYVGGYEIKTQFNSSYGYWKNGIYREIFKSTDGFTVRPLVSKVFFVSNTLDIYYMANFEKDRLYQARIYKNGVRIAGIDMNPDDSVFFDFAFDGDDLYIIGVNGSEPSIWKNGVRKKLPFVSIGDNATSISIVDKKVFLGGKNHNTNDGFVWEYLSVNNSLVEIGHPLENNYLSKLIVVKK